MYASRVFVLICAVGTGAMSETRELTAILWRRAAGHDLRVGLVMLKRGVRAREAKRLIFVSGRNLRQALGE